MKKLELSIAFLLLFTSFCPFAFGETVRIDPSSFVASQGEEIAVSVRSNLNKDTVAMQFILRYDPELLSLTNLSRGNAVANALVVNNQKLSGIIKIGIIQTYSSVSGRDQQLAILKFKVKNTNLTEAQKSALILSNVLINETPVFTEQILQGEVLILPKIPNYQLTLQISGLGKISKSPDKNIYKHLDKVQLKASPLEGYMFSQWSGDVQSILNPLNIVMDSDKNIIAEFKLKPVSGSCGKEENICLKGVFQDQKDTKRDSIWKCKGIDGGNDIACSRSKSTGKRVVQ